jgi:hypothetical protein
MCWPHVNPVPSGAVGKDCQRRLLSRPRFVRACSATDLILIYIYIYIRMKGWYVNDELERFGQSRSRYNISHYLGIRLERLWKITKTSVRITGLRIGIWTILSRNFNHSTTILICIFHKCFINEKWFGPTSKTQHKEDTIATTYLLPYFEQLYSAVSLTARSVAHIM